MPFYIITKLACKINPTKQPESDSVHHMISFKFNDTWSVRRKSATSREVETPAKNTSNHPSQFTYRTPRSLITIRAMDCRLGTRVSNWTKLFYLLPTMGNHGATVLPTLYFWCTTTIKAMTTNARWRPGVLIAISSFVPTDSHFFT